MVIVVTSIQLRSAWQFFSLSNHGRKIQGQAKGSPGFIRMKNTGWGRLHHTLSAWESAEAMHKFARTGQHLASMRESAKLATEIRTYSYEADDLPGWKEAKQLLLERGKVLHFKG